ncbi:MAG: PIN domain-containing protein [Chloroflexi bacterium]|nr:PIN domain-containing protein [Chloroflexota bacterium]MCH8342082.1 PIN domain-containing protein [Chloroflexota bacterium]MCI0773943.1 PIN domain-containing protein [Chloroflexota bacterium]MCI0806980.1 PIN domain-containing protein [Chloroflexota bacterium]MCI0828315.1 PIN domain-containing protein [Chloroflexota bacterium]
MTATLIDTNILVYAHDPSDGEKAARAIEVLDKLQATQEGRLSAQCLAEFFVVATRGESSLLSLEDAAEQVNLLAQSFQTLNVTPMIVLEASRGVREHQFLYWDSQIWATARLNQIPVVLSEDFQQGSSFEGVRFLNPFASDYRTSN